MKRIELTITALSPLSIGRQKPGGSVSETESYIPGTVIRGAIATQILQQSGHKDTNLAENGGDFQNLFLGENPAIFQNAYPAVAQISKDETDVVTEEVRVLPATAVSSKTESGFKPKGNGVFDTLIDRFCAEAYNHPYDPSDPKSLEDRTDARVEPFGGFYSKHGNNYCSHSVSTRFLTRVGINRRRATAEDDILYSIEVLNETFLESSKAKQKSWQHVVYRSFVCVPSAPDDSLADSLLSYINANAYAFRLGGATSRGLGKVKIEAKERQAIGIKSRIDEFQKKLHDRWQLWSVFGSPKENLLEGRTYFTLDLQSDAILTEQWRRTTVISPAMLCQLVGLEHEFSRFDDVERNNFLKLHVAYSSYDYRSGWNSAWGLMKDVELVTNKGAVYLFSVPEDKENDWTRVLEELEMKGIGERRCEGFGQIQFCNDFHCVFREELN